jgi:hypothetical protein
MKKLSAYGLMLALAALSLALLTAPALVANAQVAPTQYAGRILLGSGVTSTGVLTAARAPGANKTFQVVASTASGTGTATVTVQGSNDALYWDNIATLTVTSSVPGASTSTTTTDRYLWLRGNVTTLSGSTPTLSLTAGF